MVLFAFVRGTSKTAKQAAFREHFSKLHELRSLVHPTTPFIALTATATPDTKNTILETLLMESPVEIATSPDKPNVTYSVVYMGKNEETFTYLQWIADEIKDKGVQCDRVIIYCQTIKQAQLLYSMLRSILGPHMFYKNSKDPKESLLEMLHACTPSANKEHILQSFTKKDGLVRALVATIAFGMGINCTGVHTIIHYGPSKNIEAYMQECGRAGRDGQASKVFLLYNGLQLIHVDKDIKEYLKTKKCRREFIMSIFNAHTDHKQDHTCCDICADACTCNDPNCKSFTKYPLVHTSKDKYVPSGSRVVTLEEKTKVKDELISYSKYLLNEFLGKVKGKSLDSFASPEFMLGFSTLQIQQVIDNCDKLFSIQDISNFVEIWDLQHAHRIQEVLQNIFDDISEELLNKASLKSCDDSENDNDDCEQWNLWMDVAQDDDLAEALMNESLSLSKFDVTLHDDTLNSNESTSLSIPTAALEAIGNMNVTM